MNPETIVKAKVIQTRAGGYAGIASFIFLLMLFVQQSPLGIPLTLISLGTGGICLLYADYKYIFSKEQSITSYKNPVNNLFLKKMEEIIENQETMMRKMEGGK